MENSVVADLKYNELNKKRNLIIGFCIIGFLAILQIFILNDYLPFRPNGDFKWDGKKYAEWALKFPDIFSHVMTSYDVQRILPSIIVHYMMVLFQIPFTNINILHTYDAYNFILLCGMVFMYFEIAGEFSFNREQTWIGFAGVFLILATAKITYFYPTLTDTTGIFVGFLMFYAYIKEKSWLLLIATLIGAFSWPLSLYSGALLFLFPRSFTIKQTKSYNIGKFVGAAIVLIIIAFTIGTNLFNDIVIKHENVTVFPGQTQLVNNNVFIISMIFVLIFLYLAFSQLFKNFSWGNLQWLVRKTFLIRLMIYLLFAAAIIFLQNYLALTKSEIDATPTGMLYRDLISAVIQPALFLVSAIIWFGPILILGIIFYKDVLYAVKELGMGFFLVNCLNMVLLLCSESRALGQYIPSLVIIIVLTLREKRIPGFIIIFLLLVTVLLSKIWLPLSSRSVFYVMNVGPWMPEKFYVIQASVCLISFLVLYLGLRKTRITEIKDDIR